MLLLLLLLLFHHVAGAHTVSSWSQLGELLQRK
jgi:hypothetical protein